MTARKDDLTPAEVEAEWRALEDQMRLYEVNATIVVASDDPYEAADYVRSLLKSEVEFESVRVGSANAVRRAENTDKRTGS